MSNDLELPEIHQAVIDGDDKKVIKLLNQGAELEERCSNDKTPLFTAAQEGNQPIVQLLLDRSAAVDARNNKGYTPLHISCENGFIHIVGILIKHGGDVNARESEWGSTPLIIASYWGYDNIISLLLQHDADPSICAYFNYSSLALSCIQGHSKAVETLLAHRTGVDVETKCNSGYTPLLHACSNAFTHIVELLLNNGANIDATNSDGQGALHIAAAKGNQQLLKLLTKHKVKVNCRDKHGNTPLHSAVSAEQLISVKHLIQNKVEANAQNNKGLTALHLAAEKGSSEIVRHLQNVGADAKLKSKEGHLAIELAYFADHMYVVEMLKLISQLCENIEEKKNAHQRSTMMQRESVGSDHSSSGPIPAPRVRKISTGSGIVGANFSVSATARDERTPSVSSHNANRSSVEQLPVINQHPKKSTVAKDRETYVKPIIAPEEPTYPSAPQRPPVPRPPLPQSPLVRKPGAAPPPPVRTPDSGPHPHIYIGRPSSQEQKEDGASSSQSRISGVSGYMTIHPDAPATQNRRGGIFGFLKRKGKKFTPPVPGQSFVKIHKELENVQIDPQMRETVSRVYIDFSKLIIGELLGRGNFGRVYLANLKSPNGFDKVAVKTTKYRADEQDMIEQFLKEALLMKDFKHAHVLSLIGITFDLENNPLAIMPYMNQGNLRAYIRDPQKQLSVQFLLSLGLQVGRGMEYLSKQSFVHRDLACRNCMIHQHPDNVEVKVADFGLSRDLFARDYYRITDRSIPLPVRWMAPEAMKKNIFRLKSDVWSYGVLIWELLTRGAIPYSDLENWDIQRYIQRGHRLPKPRYCPDHVYAVMQSCWNEEPERRPNFRDIVISIEDHMHSRTMVTNEVNPADYV